MDRRVVLIADAQGDDWGLMTPLLGALSDVGAMTELFSDCSAGLLSAVRGGTDLIVIDMDTPSFGGLDAMVVIHHFPELRRDLPDHAGPVPGDEHQGQVAGQR